MTYDDGAYLLFVRLVVGQSGLAPVATRLKFMSRLRPQELAQKYSSNHNHNNNNNNSIVMDLTGAHHQSISRMRANKMTAGTPTCPPIVIVIAGLLFVSVSVCVCVSC